MNEGKDGDKTRDFAVATNRRALHDYFVEQTLECGLVLTGTEVKSLRQGKAQLADSYAIVDQGQAWLHHLHISPYEQGNRANHEPMRVRKLLLHKREILKIGGKATEKGFTILPLKAYFKKGRVKLEIGLARGKKAHDKRETLKRKDIERETRQAIKERRH